jgi:hypothetical protein
VKLSNRAQFGVVVAACALAAAGAAYATSKFRQSHPTASGLTPGYVGARARGWDGRPFGLGRRDNLSVAASYLGIGTESLFEQLRSGKSLAQIANATDGKSAAGLIDALVADAQSGLAEAVKDGRITQDQANGIAANLEARITELVNESFRPFGPGGRHPFFPEPPRI